jgi:hypothetical protein
LLRTWEEELVHVSPESLQAVVQDEAYI